VKDDVEGLRGRTDWKKRATGREGMESRMYDDESPLIPKKKKNVYYI